MRLLIILLVLVAAQIDDAQSWATDLSVKYSTTAASQKKYEKIHEEEPCDEFQVETKEDSHTTIIYFAESNAGVTQPCQNGLSTFWRERWQSPSCCKCPQGEFSSLRRTQLKPFENYQGEERCVTTGVCNAKSNEFLPQRLKTDIGRLSVLTEPTSEKKQTRERRSLHHSLPRLEREYQQHSLEQLKALEKDLDELKKSSDTKVRIIAECVFIVILCICIGALLIVTLDPFNLIKHRDEGTSKKAEHEKLSAAENAILTRIRDLAEKFGILDDRNRIKMLQHCATKARRQGNIRYGGDLKKALEEFLGEKIGDGFASYKKLCHEVVKRVPENKWMRFVRLHLNLEEEEIQTFKRRFATFSDEQALQISKTMRVGDINPLMTEGKVLNRRQHGSESELTQMRLYHSTLE